MPSAGRQVPRGLQYYLQVGPDTEVLEGTCRPGHFRDLATVVLKLFNAVQPHRAYFGQKDAQQLVVIRKMAQDSNLGVEIIGCPTVRETGGLAMSSRNLRRLVLMSCRPGGPFRCLSLVERLHRQGRDAMQEHRHPLEGLIAREPLAHADYISIADPNTLQELDVTKVRPLLPWLFSLSDPPHPDLTVGEKRPAIVFDSPLTGTRPWAARTFQLYRMPRPRGLPGQADISLCPISSISALTRPLLDAKM